MPVVKCTSAYGRQPSSRSATGTKVIAALLCGGVAALVLLPIAWLFVGPSLESGRLSLEFLTAAGHVPRLRRALLNTLHASLAASLFATVIGAFLALLVVRTDMPWRRLSSVLIGSAFITSSYLMAFAYVLLLGPNAGIINRHLMQIFGLQEAPFDIYTFSGYVFIATLEGVPLVFFTCAASLRNLDGGLESAARMVGAGSLRIVMTITLPLIMPAIGAGALLVFISTLSLYGAPQVLGIRVVPTEIQSLFSFPPRFDLASGIAIYLMVPALLCLLLYRWLSRGTDRFVTLGGREAPTEPLRLGTLRWVALLMTAFYVLLALVLPYAVLLIASFSVAVGNGASFENFTLANVTYVFSDQLTMRALRNSLFIASVTAAAAAISAAIIALVQVRAPRHWALGAADAIYMLPFGLPSVVIAVGVVLAFIRPPVMLYGTIWIICVALFIKFLPIAIRVLVPVFGQIDRSLEDASRICGASAIGTFARISVPLAWTGLVTSVLLVFIPVFRELGASMILSSPFNETIAFAMMSAWAGVSFEVTCAIGVLMLVVTMVLQGVIMRLDPRSRGSGT
jgi:iron(III) transport system permease protein